MVSGDRIIAFLTIWLIPTIPEDMVVVDYIFRVGKSLIIDYAYNSKQLLVFGENGGIQPSGKRKCNWPFSISVLCM